MRKILLIVLVFVILTLVYFANYEYKIPFSGLAIGIKLEQYITSHNLTIFQGQSEITRIYMENLLDKELIFINFLYEKPDGINITSKPEYTILQPKEKVPVILTFTIGDNVENKTHLINIWVKSETEENDYYESEKIPIYVTVLYNPSIIRPVTTTSTSTSTTTTILEEKKYGIFLEMKYVIITAALAFMIILLFAIPHFTFKKSPEDDPNQIKFSYFV